MQDSLTEPQLWVDVLSMIKVTAKSLDNLQPMAPVEVGLRQAARQEALPGLFGLFEKA